MLFFVFNYYKPHSRMFETKIKLKIEKYLFDSMCLASLEYMHNMANFHRQHILRLKNKTIVYLFETFFYV